MAARLRIDPGALNRTLVLELPALSASGEATGYQPGITLQGEVQAAGPVTLEDTGFAETAALLAVTIRFRTGIVAGSRFRLGARLLSIEAAADPDETGRFLRCLCREVPA